MHDGYLIKKQTKHQVKVVEPSWVLYQHSWNLKLELFYLVRASGLIINNHCSTHSSSNCSFTLNHLFILNIFLMVTAVLCLMSIPAHEASRLFHVGEQKTMNKNHLLESLLKAQVPSSTISQKAFTGHNVSPLLCPLL